MRDVAVTGVASPAFDGVEWGPAGAYEWFEGRVAGSLDPEHPDNRFVIDLDKAPRDADGRVGWRADLCILRPADPARGNGWLFYDVLNRGQKLVWRMIAGGAPTNQPRTIEEAGLGWLMREGYTVVWSGWQCDLVPAPGLMTADLPIATDGGRPVTGRSREEYIDEGERPFFTGRLTWPAASLDPAEATLTVRNRERDPRAVPEGLGFRFLDERHVEIARPTVPGYDKGAIYEFCYTARDPAVTGIAFASVRDIVSALRHGTDEGNPLVRGGRNPIRRAMLFGLSQSGRFVRDFLYLGCNRDLGGRLVFDAAMAMIPGSRKTFVNARFAQPGRYARQHEDHDFPGDQFPFAYLPVTDPHTGRTDDVLARCREQGTVPKLMHVDSESDLWSARGSLVATDCAGCDLPEPDDVRFYMLTGMQHGVPTAEDARKAANPPSRLSYGAPVRALLRGLREWVDDGRAPPSSRFPSVAAGTLAPFETARGRFPAVPGMRPIEVINEIRLMDHSRVPPVAGPAYPVLVPVPDADGMAEGGVHHPLLAAPVATVTGWNVRAPGYGEGDLPGVMGSLVPFAETKAEREAAGDPRASVEERYGDRAGWRAALRTACDRLVADRLLLADDAERLLAAAEKGEDVFTAI